MDDELQNYSDKKDHPSPKKGTIPSNYRPITCLPIMWKLQIVQIKEEIYYSLEFWGIFPEEQKGYHKGTRMNGLYI